MEIKFLCTGEFPPIRATEHSAGIDLYNNGQWEPVPPGSIVTVQTKTHVEIPQGYVGLVYVRSGLGFKGLNLINSCGVIDSDYRGEIGLKFINQGPENIILDYGDRVAQLVIVPYLHGNIKLVDELSETVRGNKGFGSTGRR